MSTIGDKVLGAGWAVLIVAAVLIVYILGMKLLIEGGNSLETMNDTRQCIKCHTHEGVIK